MEEGLRNILSVIILKGKCDRSSVVKPKFSREVAIIFSLELQSAFSDSIHFRLWRSITQRINYIIPNQHNWIWYRAITDTPQNIQNSASLSVMFAICQVKERNLIKLLAGMLLKKMWSQQLGSIKWLSLAEIDFSWEKGFVVWIRCLA